MNVDKPWVRRIHIVGVIVVNEEDLVSVLLLLLPNCAEKIPKGLAGTEYIRQNPQRDKQRVYLMVGVGVEAC